MQEKKTTLSSFLDLPFLEYQTIEKNSWLLYILSVRIEDYWKLVSDESGHLKRYLFDSEGWDFLWTNQVNEEIACAIADPTGWWSQNNVVKIIATNATILGETIQLQDIQIINGLRTTKIIYHHFQSGSATVKDRDLLIQIIVSSDANVRNRIIEATSYQSQPITTVDIQAICDAMNKIHRDIKGM